MNADISVVVPLYDKEREIARTLRSALAQTLRPREILVVDDGSTDRSAAIVAAIAAEDPHGTIRLIRQPNAGVSAARNRAIAEARGRWVALLDGDDLWRPGYLAEIARMIAAHPGCGAYATAFDIRTGERLMPAATPAEGGLVDFYRESLARYVLIPSATTLDRALALEVGGFPEGMKMGEDQYLWTLVARRAPVCCSTARLVEYTRTAQNRSSTIYTPERTAFSFETLYDPAAPEDEREYIARAALGKALVVSAKGGTEEAARTARFFAFTRRSRRTLRKLRLLNALPAAWRGAALRGYNALAWALARKGL